MKSRVEKSILIIGAGRAGRLLQSDIKKNYQSYRVIGFLDDTITSATLPVLGTIKNCQKVISQYPVDEIVIAIPSADGKLVRKILLSNLNNRLPVRIVPRSQRIITKSLVRYEEVKDIEPEDFLGRPFVRQNVYKLKQYYKDKTIFVTGGAGSIGSEIVRQLIDLEAKKVIVYDNSEYLIFMLEQQLKERGVRDRCQLIIGNILNTRKLSSLFKSLKPDIVFHAAAYKHVHLMQENIDESVNNNVIGTKRVIDAALENNVKLLTFISTDKVVNPTSVMGATKKLCEYYINALGEKKTKFNVVRFGNVINSNGSALPLFERQIALHRYVTVTHKKMERFFMSIREAAQLVIESTAFGQPGSIYVLNMGELINIYEVAVCLIRSKNLLPDQDVDARITGLRKGEKLIEELYTKEEKRNLTKTGDNRIFALRNKEVSPRDINELVSTFEQMINEDQGQTKLRQVLKTLFPSLKMGGN